MAKRNGQEEINDKEGTPKDSGGDQISGSRSAPAYLGAALRLSTSRPLGAPRTDVDFIFNAPTFSGTDVKPGAVAVPGVLSLDYAPTYGVSITNTSALNRAVFNEFNAIRSKISGNRSYEPCDHMIYRACVDSMRELYYVVRRIYGIIRRYSATNLYRPSAMLEAMGLDAQSWINNAASLYQWLLTYQGALKPFPTVPIGTITDRHLIYDTYLFTDGEPDTTQTYIMNHKWFYSYEKVDQVRGVTLRKMATTYEEFLKMWDEMYIALQTSADVYVIAADIRRAFEDKVVTDLPDTAADYEVEYKKLDDVLTSIMNASILRVPDEAVIALTRITDNGVGGLYTSKDPYTFSVKHGTAAPYLIPCHLGHINVKEAEPDQNTILQAVRLKPNIHIEFQGDGNYLISLGSVGTEIITDTNLIGTNSDGSYNVTTIATCMAIDGDYHTAAAFRNMFQSLTALSVFDWHPPVAVWNYASSGTAFWNTSEDVQNYVPISRNNLNNIHEAVLLAEFGF